MTSIVVAIAVMPPIVVPALVIAPVLVAIVVLAPVVLVAPAVVPFVVAPVVVPIVVVASVVSASSPRFAAFCAAVLAVIVPSRNGRVAPRLRAREAALDASIDLAPEAVLGGVHISIVPPRKRIHIATTLGPGSIEQTIRAVPQQARHGPLISSTHSNPAIDLNDIASNVAVDIEPVTSRARVSEDVIVAERGTPSYNERERKEEYWKRFL